MSDIEHAAFRSELLKLAFKIEDARARHEPNGTIYNPNPKVEVETVVATAERLLAFADGSTRIHRQPTVAEPKSESIQTSPLRDTSANFTAFLGKLEKEVNDGGRWHGVVSTPQDGFYVCSVGPSRTASYWVCEVRDGKWKSPSFATIDIDFMFFSKRFGTDEEASMFVKTLA